MDELRVGVIGTGGMGSRHVRNLTDEVAGARVVAVMDVDQARLDEAVAISGASHALTDAQALIDHPDVDAVVIAAPDRFHAELTLASIAAGKPVLCEKPLATSAAAALPVVEAEAAAGRRLVQVGFMREYDPAHMEVMQVVASGSIGRVLAFHGVHINAEAAQPRTVADVIANSAVHDLHSARWITGDEIARVYTSVVPADTARTDTARLVLIQLEFRNGAIGHIECNAESGYGYEVDVKITGETGSVATNSLRSAILRRDNRRALQVEEDWLQRFAVAYINEARAWIQSLRTNVPAGPSAWDGYMSMHVADACIQSAATGAPVTIHSPEWPSVYRSRM